MGKPAKYERTSKLKPDFRRQTLWKTTLRSEKKHLAAATKLHKGRQMSTLDIKKGFDEFKKNTPNIGKIKTFEGRIRLEIGDIKLIIRHLKNLENLEIKVNRIKGLGAAFSMKTKQTNMEEALRFNQKILNDIIAKKRAKRIK